MARRRGFGGRTALRQGQRRESLWVGVDLVNTSIGGGTAVLVSSLNAAALALRPFTIVRTRLHLFLNSDQQIASENQFAAVGMAVVSDQASAIGVTAVPTPITDLASDLWFLHQWMTSEFIFATAVGLGGSAGKVMEVDSRAMRKVEDGEDAIVCVESDAVSNGVEFGTMGRMLVKLH